MERVKCRAKGHLTPSFHTNKMKDKSHMSTIDAEKAFDKMKLVLNILFMLFNIKLSSPHGNH